jgi:hypothetical protein
MRVLRGTSRPRERPADAKQKQLLHVIPSRLGWSDEERREFLIARTGKRSSIDLTHREATLVLDLLFAMQRGERPPTMRLDGPTRFELEKLTALREELGAARFDGLARHLSKGRPSGHGVPAEPGTAEPRMMSGREARALLEAAKSILAREAGRSPA